MRPFLLVLVLASAAAAQRLPAEPPVVSREQAPAVTAFAVGEGEAPVEMEQARIFLRDDRPVGIEGCAGFIGIGPDLAIDYAGGAETLTITASAGGSEDLTLVVRSPDGTVHCNDDGGFDTDPALRLDAPVAGTYRIWVGVFDAGTDGGPAIVGVSEVGSAVMMRSAMGTGLAGNAPAPPGAPPDEADEEAARRAEELSRQLDERARRAREEAERRVRSSAERQTGDRRPRRMPRAEPSEAVQFRYPAIEAPDAVEPGQTFTVLVSLAEQRDAATVVVQGDTTAGGALRLPAADARGDRYSVVLHAAGFAVAVDEQPLVLFPDGDSTPARFRLTADPDTPPGTRRELHATLWADDGAYHGRFKRGLRVGQPLARGRSAPAAFGAEAPPAERPDPPSTRPVPPDLTVEMIYGLDPERPRRARVTVRAGVQRFGSTWWDEPEGTQAWVDAQLARLAAATSRGTDEEAPDPARATITAEGIGAELWTRYAPPSVRDAFWTLADQAAVEGVRFEAVQFVTNDAALPWELMRPTRPGEALGFLGVAFDVSRWHDGEPSPRRAPWAPQRVGVDEIAVVAPVYEGALALPATTQERLALGELAETRSVGGAFADVRAFLEAPGRAVLHFAGHGRVDGEAARYGQAIVLEDGPLDLPEVRGLLLRAGAAPPFVFFNACEVGQSDAAGGFVTGWGPTLLDAGAAGYVGPLWPVGDAAAAAFAEAFYRSLLAHGHVARALREARAEQFGRDGDVTALAYVYYGDPLQRVEIGE